MALGTALSRATGVVRLAVLAATLGIAETRLTDTYNLANTAPNIIYELVLGGVVTSVFVPVFVEVLQKDKERAWDVMSAILNVSLLVLIGVTILGIACAPFIAKFYSLRLEGVDAAAQQRVATFLLRLLIPQIVLYGFYFITSSILNAHKRFGPPMYTLIVNNLVLIGALLLFARLYGVVTLETATDEQLLLLGIGTTLSVAPGGLLLIPFIRRLGRYRPTLALDHPSLRKLLRLSGYAIGLVVANQLGYVVIQWLANGEQGGYSAYLSAFTFFMLPVGLFAWSLHTALVPAMSERAVNNDVEGFRERLSVGVGATLFLILPSAVGLVVLDRPLVSVFLEHGIMTARSVDLVAGVLRFFAFGLLQFCIFQFFVRAFYALQDTKSPFVINCVVVAVNSAINVPMFAWLGVKGLAAGQALAYALGIGLQARELKRRIGGVPVRRIASSAVRIAASAGGMGAVVFFAARLRPVGQGAGDVVVLGVYVVLGLVTYLMLARALKVTELDYLRHLLRRRRASAAALQTRG
jgi:putative peptidoglycan lipid II flippase